MSAPGTPSYQVKQQKDHYPAVMASGMPSCIVKSKTKSLYNNSLQFKKYNETINCRRLKNYNKNSKTSQMLVKTSKQYAQASMCRENKR